MAATKLAAKTALPTIETADRVAGCLLGGAVGDALGAPFEGDWGQSIPPAKVLLRGFAPYSLVEDYPLGQFTDDTQLTLATVEAILVAEGVRPAAIAESMAELWASGAIVAPNGASSRAALRYLKTGDWSTCGAPEGYAGNGPAARSAVLGLYFLRRPDLLPDTVASLARITHTDTRSVAGAVAIARAAQLLATEPNQTVESFTEEVAASIEPYEDAFAELIRQLPDLAELPAPAALRAMASAGIFDREFDQPIITSFVIPTVLASLWSVLRYGNDWGRAVAAVLRMGGNVDTLGSIVGSLVGIKLGVGAVPEHLSSAVHDAGRIRQLAVEYSKLVAR
jgi:ADP-ribosylglycohydrolase